MHDAAEHQHEHIKYTCPRCQKAVGQAYRFMDDGPVVLRVLIRCQDCQHRWSALIERSPMK